MPLSLARCPHQARAQKPPARKSGQLGPKQAVPSLTRHGRATAARQAAVHTRVPGDIHPGRPACHPELSRLGVPGAEWLVIRADTGVAAANYSSAESAGSFYAGYRAAASEARCSRSVTAVPFQGPGKRTDPGGCPYAGPVRVSILILILAVWGA